jgi:hypothetical protein
MTGRPAGTPPTWTFVRGTDRLTIQRPTDRELHVSSDIGPHRRFTFSDIVELIDFQLGFEDHLLKNGWSLTEFAPEHRTGPRDRRRVRRPGHDRRKLPCPRWPWER